LALLAQKLNLSSVQIVRLLAEALIPSDRIDLIQFLTVSKGQFLNVRSGGRTKE